MLISTCSVDTQALAILEFLRKIVDIFEDFLGSPLLSAKIEENYEVVAQLLAEVCDGGIICNTEPNALRETVEVSSALGRLLNQVGIPRFGIRGPLLPYISDQTQLFTLARRSNVALILSQTLAVLVKSTRHSLAES